MQAVYRKGRAGSKCMWHAAHARRYVVGEETKVLLIVRLSAMKEMEVI